MVPISVHVTSRALDDPRLRWMLAGVVLVVLDVARMAGWGTVVDGRGGGWWTVAVWMIISALVLAAGLLVSPLGPDDVRRCAGWLVAVVLFDAVWRMVLVPAGLVWVVPYLGPLAAALLVCALVAAGRGPAEGYLGAVVTALLALAVLPGVERALVLDAHFPADGRLLALGLLDLVLLLAVAAGRLVAEGIGRLRRVRVA